MLKGEIKREAELIEQCKVLTVQLGYFVTNINSATSSILKSMCFT